MTNDFFKNLTQRKNWNKRSILMFIGILGIFLIFSGNSLQSNQKDIPAVESATQTISAEEYTEHLEHSLTQLISSIDGAGEVQVAVTLESSTQTVYALNQKEEETEHIILNQAQGQNALIEMVWEPEIRGVAIVCKGADNIKVCSQITETVSVLTGVSTNRISIAKMS